MNSKNKPKVIFICSHNSARSQIAEAFLRNYANNHFEVYSAGLESTRINRYTIKVMEELNYDLSEQYSKALSDFIGHVHFGIMITVCDQADEKCPTMPGIGTRLHWSFEDPSSYEGTEEEKLEFFRKVRDDIKTKILEWLKEREIEPKNL
ncbi:arsenate reductase ArsC [Candidatus Heimdallarchaeota archaeon]|nr:MAG: arsenate reductase ArsC [Candidatus Heimdallarchaeota archaeon]